MKKIIFILQKRHSLTGVLQHYLEHGQYIGKNEMNFNMCLYCSSVVL